MNLGWRDAFYRFFVCCLAVEPAEVIIIQSRQPVNILLQVLCVALQDIVLALLEIFVARAGFDDVIQFCPDDSVHLFPFGRIRIEIGLQECLPFREGRNLCGSLYSLCPAFVLAYLFHVDQIENLL